MGAANCSICPAGWSSDIGSTKCLQCEGGKYGAVAGDICKNCQKGMYRGVSEKDVTECIGCPFGYYADKTEQRFCLGCDAGRYSDTIGMRLCKVCPNGFFQGSKRSDLCTNKNTCPSERSEINKLKTECIKPEWKTPSDCTTDVQYLNDEHLNRSRWACQDCFPGADCSGHRRWQEVTPKLGFRQMSYDNFTFGKCLNAKACNNNNGTIKCTHGHDGELCSQCIPGWAALSRTEPCEKCEESGLGLVAFVFAILIALLVFSFLVWDNLDGARMMIPKEGDDEATSTSMPFHSIAIRIVSSYLQVSGMLLKFDMTLPKAVEVLVAVESGA